MTTRHAIVDTPLGPITIVTTGDAVSGLYFRHHILRPADSTLGRAVDPIGTDHLLSVAAAQVLDYLDGVRQHFDLPLITDGDPFQESVWAVLETIPYGQTITYGEIAAHLGDRALAWQVGQAVAANPLCVLLPCHRVLGARGALTGYAGGLRRKQQLLDLERAVVDGTRPPLLWQDVRAVPTGEGERYEAAV